MIYLVPVEIPDGARIRSIIGEKDGYLYDLQIVGPIRPLSWPLHVQHPSNRQGENEPS